MTFPLPFGKNASYLTQQNLTPLLLFCYLEHSENRYKTTNWWLKKNILFNHSMYIQNRNYKAAIQNVVTTPLHHGPCARCKDFLQATGKREIPATDSSQQAAGEGNRRAAGEGKGSRGCRCRRPSGNCSSALPAHSLTPPYLCPSPQCLLCQCAHPLCDCCDLSPLTLMPGQCDTASHLISSYWNVLHTRHCKGPSAR